MATTLDIVFDRNNIETLWRWQDVTVEIPPFDDHDMVSHQVARVVRSRLNGDGSHGYPSGGTIVSTAFLAPPQLVRTDMELPVVLKIATGTEQIALLEREAAVYENFLRPLQGNVVPRFYGLYRGRADPPSRGHRPRGGMACMVLEYCTGHAASHSINPSDYIRRVKLAVWSLHQAGIIHGNLTDPRHILDLGYAEGIRFVDFSSARRHDCPCAGMNRHMGAQCHEMAVIEQQLARFPSLG